MHSRFLFLFDKRKAKTSEEARRFTIEYLEQEGFVSDLRFATGCCDWFIIGGQWSGELTRSHLDENKYIELHRDFESKYGWKRNEGITLEKRREEFRKMFMRVFPDFKGDIPDWRDDDKEGGYDDDAMLVDRAIYNKVLVGYKGESFTEEICVHEGDDVSAKFIGTKWVVVIDYHMQ